MSPANHATVKFFFNNLNLQSTILQTVLIIQVSLRYFTYITILTLLTMRVTYTENTITQNCNTGYLYY